MLACKHATCSAKTAVRQDFYKADFVDLDASSVKEAVFVSKLFLAFTVASASCSSPRGVLS